MSLWIDTRSKDNRRYSQTWFTQKFREILDEVGLDLRWRMYSCRGTHITDAIERGVSVYILAKNLGSSERMIRDEYEGLLMTRQTAELFKEGSGVDGDDRFKSMVG